jgi:hypothetical protein
LQVLLTRRFYVFVDFIFKVSQGASNLPSIGNHSETLKLLPLICINASLCAKTTDEKQFTLEKKKTNMGDTRHRKTLKNSTTALYFMSRVPTETAVPHFMWG